MNEKMEIEKKFLVKMPEFEALNIKNQFEILQTYLKNGENNSQRRVRRIAENGRVSYIYTEKIFYSAVTRKETEFLISPEQYAEFLKEIKPDCVPISKKRICFEYKNQLFELDVYPFSDSLAILELELDAPEQEIFFPEYINIIKEVTGDDNYSNSALGAAGAFPEEASAEGDS